MQCFSLEVLLERSLAPRVILQSDVAVGGEGSRKHGDVAEDRFEGLVEDICWRVKVSEKPARSADSEKLTGHLVLC